MGRIRQERRIKEGGNENNHLQNPKRMQQVPAKAYPKHTIRILNQRRHEFYPKCLILYNTTLV